MVQIDFTIHDTAQLSRNLRVFANKLDNLSTFHKEAIDLIEERTDKIFKSQGSILSKSPAWRPLSEKTLEARRKRKGHYALPPNNPNVMRWTGTLQEDRTTNYNEDYGEMRFNAFYAGFHQAGGRRLPKRAIIDLDTQTGTNIVKKLQELIQQEMGIFGRQV